MLTRPELLKKSRLDVITFEKIFGLHRLEGNFKRYTHRYEAHDK